MNKAPFSQSRSANGLVFTSGQIHLTSEGTLLDGTITEKTHQVMKNLKKILDQENITFSDVVKTTIYLVNMADYTEVNAAYSEYFEDIFPAREAICVKELPLGASIEIYMIAYKN